MVVEIEKDTVEQVIEAGREFITLSKVPLASIDMVKIRRAAINLKVLLDELEEQART